MTEASTIKTVVRAPHVIGPDTVRAFAALSVMCAHVLGPVLPDVLQKFGLGHELSALAKHLFAGQMVIVFFVVSGFCIHYPYVTKKLPIFAFLTARWVRIMIPALVALAMAKFLGLHKFNFIDGFILWSVVCELWYYSLYPLFLWLSRKVSFKSQFLLALIVSFFILICLGSDKYGNVNIYGPWLNWLVALPSWLLGCVLAEKIYYKSNEFNTNTNRVILWRVLIALIASAMGWLTLNTSIGFYLTMNPFAILAFFWIRAEINAPKNPNSTLEKIGKWSYSIYLYHIIFMVIVTKFFISSKLLSFPFILILCYLAFRAVEKPSHHYARMLFNKFQNKFQGDVYGQF